MSDSYKEAFSSWIDFPKPFQRTGKFPLDRTDLFDSYEDAVKYAKGDKTDPDSRGLCGTSYIGQIITVYENDTVTVYKINADRSIEEVGKKSPSTVSILETLSPGELSKDITLPEGHQLVSISISDSTTGEMILTDISHLDNVVTVSVAEAYENPLSIVVCYYIV